ncbi:HEPN domain-containing protein [Rothia halotolerans]|uniref:HEPN domain-containing protein n=1 Tax=Rothia halotolerans TaxID=405770 RepID=UPI00101BA945|nr:HEPN domain-containing protein [Rothia halotolerans]
MPEIIDQMIVNRRLERVGANREHALAVIETAERHVRTAEMLIRTDDHAMAFTAAYDGTRKALVAVLAVEGLRVRPLGGAHHNTGIAAGAFVEDSALGEFDWMRQVRNATEYPDGDRPTATRQDVGEAIDAATRIVEVCAAYIRRGA